MAIFIYPPYQVTIDTGNLATAAKQDEIIAELQDIETDVESTVSELQTLNTNDFATEAKQDNQITELQDIEADVEAAVTELTAVNAELDTQSSTLSDISTDTGSIDTKLTTTNSTLSNIDTSLNNMEADLDELNSRLAGSLVPETFDYVSLTYVTVGDGIGEVETATYKLGGAGGSTVATLTLAYDANDKLASVTRS